MANKISRECWQSIVMAFRPAVFHRDIAAIEKAFLCEAAMKCSQEWRVLSRRLAVEKPNYRHRWLLRACRKRPCSRRAKRANEFPPTDHSITSSARSRNDSGIVSPIALAALRLTTSSNLVGCITGKLAGFSPLRIRAV